MGVHHLAEKAASLIKYEWNMLKYCYKRILQEWKNADRGKRNLLLEDFLLHARVLKDFFTLIPKKDDVSIIHFFDDPKIWDKSMKKLCPYLKKNSGRLNKYLAHLTYSRLGKDKDWDCETIFNELENAWQQFYKSLPKERQRWLD